jgi:3-deoxy-D-manno-octulosonic-acid transferase/heptosyltransferase-1
VNILIVKLSAIGDVIHTLPSLSMLRRCWPDATISWVVEEAAADLLCGHPDLDRLIVSGRKRWLAELKRGIIARPLQEMGAFLRELRGQEYDIVIDFHGLFKSAVIALLSGGKRRLGYKSIQEGSCLFYNERIPEDMKKHAVDRYLDFVRYLAGKEGKECREEAPSFNIAIGEKEEQRIIDLLTEDPASFFFRQEDGHSLVRAEHPDHTDRIDKANNEQRSIPPFVAVNPVAFWQTKLWEDGKFARLCDLIQSELQTGVVITGEKAERIEQIRKRMKTKAVNLGGKTSLRQLAALYRRAVLLVTTDSGPMHLAAALGTPVIALFGPTDPSRTGPYGPNHRIISKGLPCSPCFKKQCPEPRCMTDISAEEVFSAVRDMLGKLRETEFVQKGP